MIYDLCKNVITNVASIFISVFIIYCDINCLNCDQLNQPNRNDIRLRKLNSLSPFLLW